MNKSEKKVNEVVEAGLDQCDSMYLYTEQRSSTPTRERICSIDNLECWDGGYNEPSNIAAHINTSDIMNNRILDSEDAFHLQSSSPSFCEIEVDQVRINDSNVSPDVSYGGAWGPLPDLLPQPPASPLPPLVESSPSESSGLSGVSSADSADLQHNFGISVFDSTDSQEEEMEMGSRL